MSGFALNKDGREIASMGMAVGDYLNNGLSICWSPISPTITKSLYHNDGDAELYRCWLPGGIAQITIPFVGWGDGFLDYDNDGWKDFFMINGHVYPAGRSARLGHDFCRTAAAVS